VLCWLFWLVWCRVARSLWGVGGSVGLYVDWGSCFLCLRVVVGVGLVLDFGLYCAVLCSCKLVG